MFEVAPPLGPVGDHTPLALTSKLTSPVSPPIPLLLSSSFVLHLLRLLLLLLLLLFCFLSSSSVLFLLLRVYVYPLERHLCPCVGAGGAVFLPGGQHAACAGPQVPGRHQLHLHRLVPRVARGGPHLRQRAIPGGKRTAAGTQNPRAD